MDHRPAPKRFSKNVSVLSYPRQKPSLVCIKPKRWSPCPLLLSRRHIKVKLPPLRLAGANFWPKENHLSCQILTNLALCALWHFLSDTVTNIILVKKLLRLKIVSYKLFQQTWHSGQAGIMSVPDRNMRLLSSTPTH